MSDNGNKKPIGANLFELKTDATLVEKGVWFEWPDDPETKFLIASIRNEHYTARIQRETRKRITRLNRFLDDVKAQRTLRIESLARFVLLDWQGSVMIESGGASVPYTYENAVKALEIDAFRDWVEARAVDEEQFTQKERADDESAIKRSVPVGSQIPPVA